MDAGLPQIARRRASGWLLVLPLAFLGTFLVYPLGRILALGLGSVSGPWRLALQDLAARTGAGPLLLTTAGQALASTALSLALGIPAAYVFARFDFPGKRALRTLLTIPFVLPTVVVASAFSAIIGPGGLVERLTGAELTLMRSLPAVLMAHVFYNVGIVVRIVGGQWAHFDPRLREAAVVLGAGRVRSFASVTGRLLLPAVAAAASLVFSYCFTSFGVVLVLGGPRVGTLETEIYRQAVYLFDLPAAAFLAAVQLAFTCLLLFGYSRLQSAMSVTMSLTPAAHGAHPPRGAAQWALVLVFGAGLTAALALPLAVLAAGSFTARGGLGLDAWAGLFRNVRQSLFWASPLTALGNSLFFSACAVALSLLIGVPAAAAIARPGGVRQGGTRHRGTRLRRGGPAAALLDVLFLLPLGTSAVTLGFGFIVSLGTQPFDLRGSSLLIPIAHSLVALPLVTRSLVGPLRSLDPRLREAAAVLGAGPGRARWEVDVPILRRAILAAAAFAFTVSMGEFAATALLSRPEMATLPVAIFRYLGLPGELNQAQAMAMSTVLMAACGLGVTVIERGRLGGTEVF